MPTTYRVIASLGTDRDRELSDFRWIIKRVLELREDAWRERGVSLTVRIERDPKS